MLAQPISKGLRADAAGRKWAAPAHAGHTRALPTSEPASARAEPGRRLPRDHGFPVRLVVPGWVGIASIKWVGSL